LHARLQIANMPLMHVEAQGAHGCGRSGLWCVLDTGAVGGSLILSYSAARELGLINARDSDHDAPAQSGQRAEPAAHAQRDNNAGSPAHAPGSAVMSPPVERATVRGLALGRHSMEAATLPNVWLGRRELGPQRVYFTRDAAAMQTSAYGSSLAAMNLLRRVQILLDVRNRRVAFRDEPQEGA
jgi:hypothetical protein